MLWLIMAVGSAVLAGFASILVKCGIKKMDSDLATAFRTAVILLFSWWMVLIVGSADTIGTIHLRSFIFLLLSGISTGLSWICYFKALSMGDVNKVVPIDKSSTLWTMLLAIFLFGEVRNLPMKLLCTALLGLGIFLMVEKKEETNKKTNEKTAALWRLYALASAIFAALTSILAKIGVDQVESNLATAIRTGVVLLMVWLIVFLRGKHRKISQLDKKEMGFVILSGLATGGSWLCFYYAIQNGIVSVVVPIDKLSILVSILFSYLVFHEKLTKKACLGLGMMVVATLLMVVFG